jgi:hypothetical protein
MSGSQACHSRDARLLEAYHFLVGGITGCLAFMSEQLSRRTYPPLFAAPRSSLSAPLLHDSISSFAQAKERRDPLIMTLLCLFYMSVPTDSDSLQEASHASLPRAEIIAVVALLHEVVSSFVQATEGRDQLMMTLRCLFCTSVPTDSDSLQGCLELAARFQRKTTVGVTAVRWCSGRELQATLIWVYAVMGTDEIDHI